MKRQLTDLNSDLSIVVDGDETAAMDVADMQLPHLLSVVVVSLPSEDGACQWVEYQPNSRKT